MHKPGPAARPAGFKLTFSCQQHFENCICSGIMVSSYPGKHISEVK
jgi:hypothetical protein